MNDSTLIERRSNTSRSFTVSHKLGPVPIDRLADRHCNRLHLRRIVCLQYL